MMFIDAGSHECTGERLSDIFFSPNYRDPFVLSFTVNADRSYGITRSNKYQWIFRDRSVEGGQRIAVIWMSDCNQNEDECEGQNNLMLRIQSSNQLESIDIKTPPIYHDNDLFIKLQFDGKYCTWFLNDTKVGDSIDCAGGFRKLGSSSTCIFNGVKNGWRGKIMDMKFENYVLVKDFYRGRGFLLNENDSIILFLNSKNN